MAAFNGPSWTLGVEFLFYAAFPLLFVFQTKLPRAYLLFTIGIVVLSGWLWTAGDFNLSHRVPHMRLWEFCVGVCVAYHFPRIRKLCRIPGNLTAWALAAMLCGILAGAYLHHYMAWDFAEWLLMGLFATVMILLLAKADSNGAGRRPLSLPLWVIGGEISYGVYLIHDGIQRYAKVAIERVGLTPLGDASAAGKLSFILLSFAVSVVAALALWKILEIPARGFLRRKLSPKH